jgi:hypothetical protein
MDGPLAKAVVEKKPIPEIDFTLHIMEDGSQVSTQERVCKGTFPGTTRRVHNAELVARCSGTSHAAAYGRAVLVVERSIETELGLFEAAFLP